MDKKRIKVKKNVKIDYESLEEIKKNLEDPKFWTVDDELVIYKNESGGRALFTLESNDELEMNYYTPNHSTGYDRQNSLNRTKKHKKKASTLNEIIIEERTVQKNETKTSDNKIPNHEIEKRRRTEENAKKKGQQNQDKKQNKK
jgi:hypothetical protein